jgi:branched-chain amino acid transport system permease protein
MKIFSRTNRALKVLVVIVLLVFPLLVSAFTVQVAITTIIYAMLGLAFALSMKVGLPRMDVAAWWGVGGYTTALLLKAGMSFWFAMLISGVVAVILGLIFFSICIPRGMMAFFIFCMILSMAFYQAFGSVPIFGGWGGITGLPAPSIGSYQFIAKRDLYYLGLVLLGINCLVYYLLYNSRIGRAWNAIGSSLKLSRSLGINVVKYRMANVLIGNFFIALAGSFFIGYYRAAMPTIFSFQAGLFVLIYLIVGGFMFSISGPIVGALVVNFIPEYFRFAREYQSIVTSAVVILLLMYLPMGILGWLKLKVRPWLVRRGWFPGLSASGEEH